MSTSERPDSRVFASYPMPAKIDLLNERPRRESQVERHLERPIDSILSFSQTDSVPRITVTEQHNVAINNANNCNQPQQSWSGSINQNTLGQHYTEDRNESPGKRCEIKETRIVINQHSNPIMTHGHISQAGVQNKSLSNEQLFNQQSATSYSNDYNQQANQLREAHAQHHIKTTTETTTTTTTNETNATSQQQQQHQYNQQQQHLIQQEPSLNKALNKTISNNRAVLAAELAEKEAKLMREISALHQRPYSPYQTPAKIDLTSEQWASQQQHRNAPTSNSRPNSRLSNKSNPGQDLLEKEARLLKEIEEIESKPYNPQTMVLEREQWYEYPGNRPNDRHLTESKRRVRDFCSMPPGLYQDRHVHEENLPPRPSPATVTPESIHTTIIRSPKHEIDNKSPLPFAFDNFTTKGVRGNIASVGAVEPDRPRPPIFPIVKRSPSPNVARG